MKRKKTVTAGRLVYAVAYTVPNPRTGDEERRRILEVTAEQVARTNCNTARRKLELLIACNFEPHDLVITPTYRDGCLPADYKIAQRRLYKVLAQIREYRKAHGLPEIKYIYVTEGLHGDHRLHHHIIINAAGSDLALFRSLWIWGDDIQLNYIRDRGYDGWAGYLTKERREASLNGKKQFVPSRNLERPKITHEWIDDNDTVDAPPGATVLDEGGGRNELASCKFIKYLLPVAAAPTKKHARARVLTGLEYPVTYRRGVEKRSVRPRQTRKSTLK